MALPYSPHVTEGPPAPGPGRFNPAPDRPVVCARHRPSYAARTYTSLTDCLPFAYVYDPFRRGARDGQVFDNSSLPAARVGGGGKGLFQVRGTRLRISRSLQGPGPGAGACHG